MSAFFNKGKTHNKLLGRNPSASSPTANAASSSKSEFERAFKPFIVKRNTKMAPANEFRSRTVGDEVILIDDETLEGASKSLLGPRIDPSDTRDSEGVCVYSACPLTILSTGFRASQGIYFPWKANAMSDGEERTQRAPAEVGFSYLRPRYHDPDF